MRSENLYQIFAYLKNLEARGGQDATAAGMLLYPTVDQSLRLDYEILGHKIYVCTLNLNQDWQSIMKDLLLLVDDTFGARAIAKREPLVGVSDHWASE